VRKAGLFALMLTLLLTACGGEGERDPAAALQEQYAAVAEAEMEAEITCHYGGEVRSYTMECGYTPEKSRVTVLAPQELAGISAEVEKGELLLSYEDISLDAGTYSGAALSPVTVLPELMEAAAAGYVTEMSREPRQERDCLRMSCGLDRSASTVYTTWFDEETLLPMYSEVVMEGTLVYQTEWSRFQVTERVQDAGETEMNEDQPAVG